MTDRGRALSQGLWVLGLALVACLAWSASEVQRGIADGERRRGEDAQRGASRRAAALQAFLAGRLADGQRLAADPGLAAALERASSSAPGPDGAAAGAAGLRVALDAFRGSVRLGQTPVYRRVAAVDAGGAVLADARGQVGMGEAADAAAPAATLLAVEGAPAIVADGGDLVLSVPLRARGSPAGHVLAWVSLAELSDPLAGLGEPGNAAAETGGPRPASLLLGLVAALGAVVVLAGGVSLHAARRERGSLRRLLEGLPFAVVALDGERHVAFANAAAERVLAAPPGGLAGHLWDDFVPREAPGAPAPEAPAGPREVLARDAEERSRPLLLAELPARLAGEELRVAAFLDLSEQRVLEARLQQATKLGAVGQLAAGIAHEINSPMQSIGDNLAYLRMSSEAYREVITAHRAALGALAGAPGAEALLARVAAVEDQADLAYVSEATPGAFERAAEGVARVTRIVRAMKEFAHAGPHEMAPADLNRALENTLAIARNEYRYVAELETELAALPPVTCNLGDVNQVLLNIVVNAAHAVHDAVGDNGGKGRIHVRTSCEGPAVRIDVTDTGCGIPEAIRDRIFDPSFTTKAAGRASGQGLAYARSIVVVQHGGSLTFESTVGRGSTFTVRLPVAGPDRRDARRASAEPVAAS
ncbi:MAG: ATP-binding protein [Anaeromyxobacter sp.]